MTLLLVLTLTSSCFVVGVWNQVVKSNSLTHLVEMVDLQQSSRHRRDVLDPHQRSQIVDIHNAVRRLEGASDMQLMIWNNALADMADGWADGCAFVHGQPSVSNAPFNPVGQNLYAVSGAELNVTRAVIEWYNEKTDYNYDTLACTAGRMCGHYTQVVWSSSREVGCAYQFCRSLTNTLLTSAYFFVCNYGPAGNFQGMKPFKRGSMCSNCLNGIGWCTDGLCNNDCKSSGPSCKCGAVCYNCATLQSKSCTCQCVDGWNGNDCSALCQDTSKNCNANPGWPPQWCNHPQNGDYVRAGCPAMCGLCKQVTGVQSGLCSPVGGLGSTASVRTQRPLLYSFIITAAVVLFTRCQLKT